MNVSFCYNYKPQGFINPVCKPVIAATNEYMSSIASIPAIVNGTAQTSQRTRIAATQQATLQQNITTARDIAVSNTQINIDAIEQSIYAQLATVGQQRYVPYKPYIPPVIPLSVMQLEMATRNVGTPMTNIMRCKGNQSFTR
jgi:hypothetical protein